MFCSKCGNGMNETAKFCPSCGNLNESANSGASQQIFSSTPNNVQEGQMSGQLPPQQNMQMAQQPNVQLPPQQNIQMAQQPNVQLPPQQNPQMPQQQNMNVPPQYGQPNYNQQPQGQGQYTQPNYGQPQGQPNYQMNGNPAGAAYGNPQQGMYNTDAVEYVVSSNMFENFKIALTKQFATFSGRSTRWEFWSFEIIATVITMICEAMDSILGGIAKLIFTVPAFALAFRRAHDSNHPGWYSLIPFYGLYLVMIAESDPLPNQYGKVRKQKGNI